VKGLDFDTSALIHYQQKEAFTEAKIVQIAPQRDLALLECHVPPNTELPCVYLDKTVQPGNQLYFFGYPDQDFPQGCPVTGSCEGLTGDIPPLIKFKLGQVRPGMSGSALLNQDTGKVCGIVKFTRDRTYDLGGGAITSSVILKEFPQLQELQRQTHSQAKRWDSLSSPPDCPANLPRSGVVKFVGRKETVIELHQLLQQSEQVAVSAIAGMGGIGKTELALQYALSYQQTYSGGICWLQSRSGDVGTQIIRFVKSHLDLIPSSGMELIDQVKYCWRNWPTGKVLLVFDNVTDYEALQPYLPPSNEPRFKVLMTTRKRIGISVHELQLDVLDEAAALYLLKALAGDERIQSQVDAAKKICLWLGYLPLGLELVGRYLARKTDLPLVDLLDRLRQQQLAAKALCQTEADMTAKRGVASAFQLSW
ncbi:MAG: NB-ARC domain-containing protein, partial [Cyanobacteria bacterium J06555_13]